MKPCMNTVSIVAVLAVAIFVPAGKLRAAVDFSTEEKLINYLADEIDKEHPEGREPGARLLHKTPEDAFDMTFPNYLTFSGRWIRTPDNEILFPYANFLKDPEAIKQVSAISLLMNYPSDNGNAFLVKLTAHPNFLVRLSAALALENREQHEADALIKLLDDPSPDVRLAAILALGPKSNPYQPHNSPYWRLDWEFVLEFTPDLRIFPKLEKFLKSADVSERIAVANTLRYVCDERAILPLIALLNDDNATVRRETVYSLDGLRALNYLYYNRKLISDIAPIHLEKLNEYAARHAQKGDRDAKAVMVEIEHLNHLAAQSRVVQIAPPKAEVKMKVNPKDGQQYVWIPAGSFTMGCSAGDNECADDEKPAHEVTIPKGFWMSQTPATFGAWKRYMQQSGKPALRKAYKEWLMFNDGVDDSEPIVVSWDEARSFCEWTGGRLPTEAEWEYAARAGSMAPRYGNLDDIAWYTDNSGNKRIDSGALTGGPVDYMMRLMENGNGSKPVGQKLPNAWHLYDMLGNVKQWVADWYSSDERDPLGVRAEQSRVLRGGAWMSVPRNVRVSSRDSLPPDMSTADTGFRCVAE